MSDKTPEAMTDAELIQAAIAANQAIADAQAANHANMNELGATLGAIRLEAQQRNLSVA